MRLELVKLKTDIEEASPELESFYRGAMEGAIGQAQSCDLISALDQFSFGKDLGHALESRLGIRHIARLSKIEILAVQAIVEALNLHCKCEIQKQS